jgi:uncharacterized repeat protein (TIGR01451 family)
MTRISLIGQKLRNRFIPSRRTRKRSARLEPRRLRVEQLETRLAPSVNPTTPFELDGNTTHVAPTHDWDQIFADAGSPTAVPGSGSFTRGPTSLALAGAFINDRVNTTADDIFTGGGSKDTQGIQAGPWLYTGGKPQGKDDIAHAMAGAYIDSSTGHLILYAGVDRFDNSGDSTMGFWFFGNNISEGPLSKGNGTGGFLGTHQTGHINPSTGAFEGDILLISNFTQGGSVSTIAVYGWMGTDATGSLQFLGGNSSNTYAITNGTKLTTSPWLFLDKKGNTAPDAGELFEGGIDLTALNISGCFTNFLAETRSSQSPTATLSDFALGGFPLCSLQAPQFAGLSKFDTRTGQGDVVTYPLMVTNSGAMPLYIQSVSDSLLGNIVVNHTLQAPVAPVTSISSSFNFSTPLGVGQTLTINVTRPVQAGDADPTPDTVSFVGTDDLAGADEPITASAINSVNLFQPSATLSETASPTAGVVGTPITYTYTVTNTSSPDSPNLVLDLNNPNSSFTSTLFGNIEADAIHAFTSSSTATVASIPPRTNGVPTSFTFTETHIIGASPSDLPGPINDSSVAHFTLANGPNGETFPNIIFTNTAVAPVVHIVDANVSIAPNAFNEVGVPHTFTVTVNQTIDGVSSGAANANVTVTLDYTNGATDGGHTTLTGTTNPSGQFQVTFVSPTAGQVTGKATATLSVLGVSLTRKTGDSNAGDSGPAVKTYEDATISIGPNGVNGITESHTFTATVMENLGQGGGWVAASGVPVTITLANTNGSNYIVTAVSDAGSTTDNIHFVGTTDASGHFSVTFTSTSAGDVIGNASTTFTTSDGVTLTRATSDSHTGDSGAADKTFVAGSLKWLKVDGNNNNAPLGGATFLVTATGGTAFSNLPGTATVVDNTGQAGYSGLDADPRPGYFQLNAFQNYDGTTTALTGLAMGTYTVQEITPPTGYTLDPKIPTATLTLAAPNADLTGNPFVDTKPVLTITKTASSATVTPGQTVSFTITVNNTGAGTAQNVVVTDQLPEDANNQLAWKVVTPNPFDTYSISSSELLTATEASLAGNTSISITVSALVPLSFFGNIPNASLTDGIPPNLFELDGNTTVDTSGGHDWNQVFSDFQGTTTNASGARAVDFVNDAVNTTKDDIFTAGGSKDIEGIQQGPWLWTNGKPQGKDDIENAAAALYTERSTDPNPGDTILYAMVDRYDNSGDSTMGFWFFVNQVGLLTGKKNAFSGSHSTGFFDSNGDFHGDILVISDFSIGGSTSTPAIYGWLGDDATGSLVLLDATTTAGKAAVVVNSGPITVPWNYVNKSGAAMMPDHGEFLEEGINLTSLGLSPCFTSFLAETRSSTSTSATLSDFVLGPNFQTCQVVLTNTATVKADNFNNGVPITSNQVTVTINDVHALEATSSGPGAAPSSLTDAQLQPLVAQAVNYWRGAGVALEDLHALDNVSVQLTSLAGGELGLEAPGHISIDRTAAGWGWSVTGGQMDLSTVITHEVGHALGFEHSETGVMAASLAPGVRLTPEAAGISTFVASPTVPSGAAVSAGASSAFVRPGVAPSTPARAGTVEAALAIGVRDTGAQPAAGAIQDVSGNQRSLAGALLSVGQQPSPILLGTTTVTAAPAAEKPLDAGARLVPALLPPTPRMESGASPVLPNDATEDNDPVEWLVPKANPTDLPWGSEANAQAGRRLQRSACDVCFADGSWRADAEEGNTLESGAVAALAVLLGGYWGAQRTESEQRRRGFLS